MTAPEDIASIDANAALDELEKREPVGLRGLGLPRADYRREQGGHVGGADLVAKAEALGFESLGTYSFMGTFFNWSPRDGWVDATRVVWLSLRAEKSASPVTNAMSRYFLSTKFDDGNELITWSKSPAPVPGTARVDSRGGSDNLESDYAAHLALVRARTKTRRALAIGDLDAAMRLSRWSNTRLFAVGYMRIGTYAQLVAMAFFAVYAVTHARWAVFATIAALGVGMLSNVVARPLLTRPPRRD